MSTSPASHGDKAVPNDSPSHLADTQEIAGLHKSTADINYLDDRPAGVGEYLSHSDKNKEKVIYRVEYRDRRGRVLEKKTANHPLQTASPPGDHAVLEISCVLTDLNDDTSGSDGSSEDGAPSRETGTAEVLYDSRSYKVSSKTLTIHSEKLANALRAVVHYSPDSSLIGQSFSFEEPYSVLFHHSAELENYRRSHPATHSNAYKEECNEEIDLLLGVLSREKPEFGEEKGRYMKSPPVCTFNLLWLLFKPGEICYRKSETGEISAYVVRAVTGGSAKGRPAPYRIYLWLFNFDGYQVGREIAKVVIAPFGGEKDIRLLECFPCRFYEDVSKSPKDISMLRQRLIARGKKFWRMTRDRPYVEYNGISLIYPYETIRSRVMVDPKTFYSSPDYLRDIERDTNKMPIVKPHLIGLEPPRPRYRFQETEEEKELRTMALDGDIMLFMGCQCDACRAAFSETHQPCHGRFAAYAHLISPGDAPPNEDEFFLLCGFEVVAFVLREGKWKKLNVEHVQEVMSRSNAFDHLVLEPGLKEVVEGLSRSYSRSKKSSQELIATDFIKGKGEGRVFLLHGPPGVGKTATAEAIADYTHRPLLALTCGDLGSYSSEIETKLRQYFEWGELWGAVVLLDEADIYLEKRNLTDVHRNSIVSVFLRALEYYRGLLFLTTNRVNTFDEAFTSRIHVALHYRKLQDSERRAIWLNSFERSESNKVKVTKAAQRYACESREVLDLEWNGREIRNAFQTAISLAEVDADEEGEELITVRKEHFERVVRLSAHFQKYLATMHRGMSESEIAKRRGLRNDSYGEMPQRGKAKQPLFRNKVHDDEDEDEDEDEAEDRRLKGKDERIWRQKGAANNDTEDSLEEDVPRKSSKGKKAVRYKDSGDSEEETPRKTAKTKKSLHADGDEEFEEQPRKSTKSKKPQPSDEESEEEPPKKPAKSKKPVRADKDEKFTVKFPSKRFNRSTKASDSKDE